MVVAAGSRLVPVKKPTKAEFETFVGELMKVDPAGLSGKHKADKPAKGKSTKKAPPK